MRRLVAIITKNKGSTKVHRGDALNYIRSALVGSDDDDDRVDALSVISYECPVHRPAYKFERNTYAGAAPQGKRRRVETKETVVPWSPLDVVVELLAWYRESTVEVCHVVRIVGELASPAHLGGETLAITLRAVARAAACWDAWAADLTEDLQDQLDGALAFHRNQGKNREEDSGDAKLERLHLALCSEVGADPSLGVAAKRRRVWLQSSDNAALQEARARLSAVLSSTDDDPDYAGIGEAARLCIVHDPLDETASAARRFLMTKLQAATSVEAPASALVQALNGLSNDGSSDLLLQICAGHTNQLSGPFLSRLRSLKHRPRARFMNLDRATDRRQAMARLALVHGVELERVSAVDGALNPGALTGAEVATHWSDDARILNAQFDQSSRGDLQGAVALSPSERGCAATHVALWRRAALDDTPVAILEDDVVFAPHFASRFHDALNDVPDDFDLLLLGYWSPKSEFDLHQAPVSLLHRFLCLDYFWGLHAYILSPRGAKKLLTNLPVDAPADVFVAKLVNDGSLVTYALKHKLVKQRTQATSSVVHTNRENSGVVASKKKAIQKHFDPVTDLRSRCFWS